MKIETRFTKLVDTELPIVGGAMMDISKADFVAAISDAGALGVLASAIYKDYGEFRDDIKAVKDKTDKPFAVNINLFPMMNKLDNNKYLEIMKEEGVNIVEMSGFAPPEELVSKVKSYGMTWIHKCVGVRYARKAEALGADAVTVVGYENGGATGNLNVTTMVLVPSTVHAVSMPVIGGGGIVDGASLLAVLSLGASGAIVGTRLLMSEECPIHRSLKEKLLEATETDTAVIMRSVGFAHRVWLNGPARKVVEIEAQGGDDILPKIYPYVSGESAKKMFDTGDTEAGSISLSQGIGLIREIKPVREILHEMVEQALEIHRALPFG
ncbi:MAG: nitronate monooxygenase [Deltaproteobacteria bacterium]|nr:nitronate monooxygenase [Deltaproteobacteria bacterium]